MATVTLPDDLQTVIDAEVRAHGYADASEYLATLVRQEQKRLAKERLQAMIIEGMESGDPIEMTDEVWEDLRLDLHRRAGLQS